MKTIKKSDNGKVLLTERNDGFSVSIWETRWSITARMYIGGWETLAKGLSLKAAEALFAAS